MKPVIAWNNLLKDSTYTVTAGTEVDGYPVTNAHSSDINNVSLITADTTGKVEITFNIPDSAGSSTPYGFGRYGSGKYGKEIIECFIIGASRHDSGGFRTVSNGVITVSIDTLTVLTSRDVTPENSSVYYPIESVAGSEAVITITGYSSSEVVVIPELYLGPILEMPYLDLGFDSYNEVTYGKSFIAESGREYPQLRYRAVELRPSWSQVESDLWQHVDLFREGAIEIRSPLWFIWNPNINTEVYLMRHRGRSASFKYVTQITKSFSLDLKEAL